MTDVDAALPPRTHEEAASIARFASDVQYYLKLQPRQLPSRYLYDELGSALFDAICLLPWYQITRAEMQLLAAHGRSILAHIPLVHLQLSEITCLFFLQVLNNRADAERFAFELVNLNFALENGIAVVIDETCEDDAVARKVFAHCCGNCEVGSVPLDFERCSQVSGDQDVIQQTVDER